MADYLYNTVLYTDKTGVADVPADNDANLADFNTNHSADVPVVDDVTIATTTFIFDKTYSDFEAIISDPIEWTDVKCYDTGGNRHILYIISNTEL